MKSREELLVELTAAKELLGKMSDKLQQVMTSPRMIATVVRVVSDTEVTVLQGANPMRMTVAPELKLKPGSQVLLSAETRGIVEATEEPLPGSLVSFVRYIDEQFIEVDPGTGAQERRIIYCNPGLNCEPGDLLLVEPSRTIAIRNTGKPPLKGYTVSPEFNVQWDDIGGLDDVRDFFAEVFEAPILHPKVYSYYNMKPPKGVLMTGPPGCGKSLVAKAVATMVTSQAKGGNEGGFLSVKGPEILSPYVGMAEIKIRQLFDSARDFFRRTGFPAVIFIDECESVMNKRGSGRSSDVDRTIVPAFLTEMDGLEISGAIVILATNRPELLDTAITREGRIDRKICIPRPTLEACKRIFHIHLRSVPLATSIRRTEVHNLCADYLFSDAHQLYRITRKRNPDAFFCLRDVASGAMIATICQQATQTAMSRDIKTGKPKGVTFDDLQSSIDSIKEQHTHVDHKDDIAGFVADWRDDMDRVLKVAQ